MQKTLRNILDDIAAYIDQDTVLATGTDLTVRVNLVNQSLDEWGNAYQWKQLRINDRVSFAFSGTSFALKTNFKKPMSVIVDESKAVSKDREYKQIKPEDRHDKSSTDKYFYITGDDASGRSININPPLDSGWSGAFDYQAFPSSMATLQDISVCPQPNFLVKRTAGLLLESRSDNRFPFLKADADNLLRTMIEEEDSISAAQDNRTPDWARSTGFVIGES